MKVFLVALALCVMPVHAADPATSDYEPGEVAAFAKKVQAALRARDVEGVIALSAMPLRVNLDKGKVRRLSREQLGREFDRIFSPPIVKEVLDQDPESLFENWQGVMFGSGAVWAAKPCESGGCTPTSLRIIVVNAK